MGEVRQETDGGTATVVLGAASGPIEAEDQLICACKSGDQVAYHRLFDLYRDRVFTLAAYHLNGDAAAAEDVVQTVFVKLFRTIGQFRKESDFSTWLYRSVANACMDEHRRRKKWLPWASVPEPAYSLDLDGVSETVRAAVEKLSPKLRMPILLKYFEGMSYEEIAITLGCSMGTVASRLNRAHKMLSQHLRHLREDSDA
ncbi:MAG TPA: sigma-70 family RNA polymerase sigma factor [Fimbriimonas sp.]|nr:sigma-70 family RNA polymerase sigma factor [Fimbriimonas sp.]